MSDVNGFSFVKGNDQYFDDTATVLNCMFLEDFSKVGAEGANGCFRAPADQQSWLRKLADLCKCFCCQ